MFVALVGLVSSAGRPAAAAPPPGAYHPPVDAAVTDPFRPPSHPYGPGNRGLQYATAPGSAVVAIAPGTVTYAGAVAGVRYVTVRHPDGLRSSYGHLASIDVAEGDAVTGTSVVGRAGSQLHLGVRRGDEYLDPALLWGRPSGEVRPFLVPLDANPGAGASGDVRGLTGTDRPPRTSRGSPSQIAGRAIAEVADGLAALLSR